MPTLHTHASARLHENARGVVLAEEALELRRAQLLRRGAAWRGAAWRGVAWRGVAWRGVANSAFLLASRTRKSAMESLSFYKFWFSAS